MWWQLLILQVGFFLLLLLALKKLFHGHLLSAIARMEKLQQQNLKKEDDLKRRYEQWKQDVEQKTHALNEELSSKRRVAEEEVRAIKENAMKVMAEEKEAQRAELGDKERLLIQRHEREASNRAAELAFRMVLEAFSPAMLKSVHEKLAEELLQSLSASNGEKKKVLSVEIASAFPLSADQKEKLRSAVLRCVETKNGDGPAITEKTDPALAAGFVLTLGQQILDGSLRNRFVRFTEQMK